MVPYSLLTTLGAACVLVTTGCPFDLSLTKETFILDRGTFQSRPLSVLPELNLAGDVDKCFAGLDSSRIFLELTVRLSGGLCAVSRFMPRELPAT